MSRLPSMLGGWTSPWSAMQRELERALDPDRGNGGDWAAAYPVDVRETDENVVVEAELPGFDKKDVSVALENGILTIQARREEEAKEGEHHLRERRFTRVARSFTLPSTVDEDNVDAQLEEGVLTLTMRKKESVRPRKIEVQ